MTMFNSATVVSVGTEDQMQVVTVLLDDGTEKAFAALYSPVIVHTDPRKRLPLWTLQPGTVVNVDAPTHAAAGWGFQIVEFSPVLEIEFVYTNYEGETRLRKAIPLGLRFEQTEWHGLQMIMVGWDTEKQAERSYALGDCVFKTGRLLALESFVAEISDPIRTVASAAGINDEMGRVVVGQTDAARALKAAQMKLEATNG